MALIDDLVSYWDCGEASGNLLDAHASNDLTDTNTVGSGTGIIGNARDFNAASQERFMLADNADLSFADDPVTFSLWANFDSVSGFRTLLAKGGNTGSDPEYEIRLNNSATLQFLVWGTSGSGSNTIVTASNYGAVSTGGWLHIVAWHDPTANEIGIAINDGTANTASHTAGIYDGAGDFDIGRFPFWGNYFDGRLDEIGVWNRVLTSGERTSLYGGGAGLAYPFSGGGSIVPLVMHLAKMRRAG